MRLHPIDFAVLAAYLAGITLFGLRFRRGQRDLRDYFLGGRTAPWWAVASSIVATETSTLTIIGTPAIAFGGNLAFLQLVIGYLVARIVLCIVFLPQYFRGEFYTAYQLIEKRFGARMKARAAAVFVVTRALAEGVRIAAIGKVTSVVLGTGDRASVFIVAVLTLAYTFEGGMKAVIWTDVAQLALYLTGSVTALALAVRGIPGGWAAAMHSAAASGKLQVFDFTFSLTKTYTFWSGVIGGTFLTMASHGTDQTMVQRLLAARSERESKIALLASGALVFVQFALFLLIGALLYVTFGGVLPAAAAGDADRLLPVFIATRMPAGLAGLVLSSVFAVAMSNASGSLNSLASSTVLDFRRSASAPADGVRRSRRITLLWAAVLCALGMIHWGAVLEAGLTIASITYGALLGLFFLCLWNRRATSSGATAGMVIGLLAMVAIHFFTPLAWTWYVLAGTLITYAVGSLSSALSPAKQSSEA